MGLTAWLSFWQFAIFAIIFHFREDALPMLREVAFGEYDWTQANAIEILCRLAAEGIDRDRILADLKREIPEMRDTALLYVARPLLEQAKSNPALAAIIAELQQTPEFQEAVEELQEAESARNSPMPPPGKPEWQGVIVNCERSEQTTLGLQVIASCLVQGLATQHPDVKASGGSVQVRISTKTQIEKLMDGQRFPATLEDLKSGVRVEIGSFSFTQQTTPVTVFPESVLVLG